MVVEGSKTTGWLESCESESGGAMFWITDRKATVVCGRDFTRQVLQTSSDLNGTLWV